MPLSNILSVGYEIAIGISILVLINVIVLYLKCSRRNFPPGPWGLPVVGYIPFLSKRIHLQFVDIAKKYGDVFSLRLGSQMMVVLNDTASIREALLKQEFVGRPPHSSFYEFEAKKPFVVNDITMWSEHRRFVINSLKDLGYGKTKLEEQISNEIKEFIEVLKSFKGQPIDLTAVLTPIISNNISNLIFGKRYDYDDPERKTLDENLDEINKILAQNDMQIFFPWIKHISFLRKRRDIKKYYKLYKESEDIFRKQVEEHKNTLDNENVRDFIDNYLVQMKQKQKKDCKFSFSEEALVGLMSGLTSAGSETVRTSIEWLLYTMASFLDVQKKVQEEILEVLGPDRNPEFQDQISMPFSHAVMLEVMRWKTIIPSNLFKYTLGDTSVAGYDIPAGTFVMTNFWAVHNDPRNWKDPEKFKPERFLSPDGKSVVKSPHYMPFSIGKRVCPGKTMAYMEVFLCFVSILQKFDVRFPEGYKPTFEGIISITYRPPPNKIRFIPKN